MVTFRERLTPGIGTWSACLLLLPGLMFVFMPISILLGVVVAVLGTAALYVILAMTSPVVEVRDGVLHAARAHIDLDQLGEGTVARGADATAARGPGLDARAWCLIRGWIDPVVRIALLDEDDPAPYWLISSRRPEALAGALATSHRSR